MLPCPQRRRGQREAAALAADSLSLDTGRPSRRAATAAQAAIAQTHAYEHPRAGAGMSPRRAEQTAAARLVEDVWGPGGGQGGGSPRSSPRAAVKVESEAEAFAAAAIAAAVAATRGQGGAATAAGSGAPVENGMAPGGKKRKRLADGALAAAAAPAAPSGAAPAHPQSHSPSQEVDLAPVLDLARASETQEELRLKLQERYPPTRGRAAVNTMFRDLFLTLCPGQLFHVSCGTRRAMAPAQRL